MKLLCLFLSIFVGGGLLNSADAATPGSRFRLAGSGGFGQAVITSQSNDGTLEGPLGFSVAVDYMMSSQMGFGAEHIRSVGSSGSAVGLTGMTMKWYFWLPHPSPLLVTKIETSTPTLQVEGWIPYVGGMFGVGQAGVLDSNITSVGLSMGAKGGIEFPFVGNWGFRTEANLAVSSGTGSIVLINTLIGVYVFL